MTMDLTEINCAASIHEGILWLEDGTTFDLPALGDTLQAIEGYLANKAHHGDDLAKALRTELIAKLPEVFNL